MSGFAIILDGMQAVLGRGVLKWVPLEVLDVAAVNAADASPDLRRVARVEPCHDCGSMKPLGAKYHAPLLRTREAPHCKHGRPYYTACMGQRVPPPCCWGDEP